MLERGWKGASPALYCKFHKKIENFLQVHSVEPTKVALDMVEDNTSV